MPTVPGDRRTVVFFPEGAFGPTNNCVGIGAVLRERGHRVVFVVEESFAGTLAAHGFEERLMRLAPPPTRPEAPGQFWKDFVRDTAPVFRQPTLEQLGGFVEPTWRALCDGARYVEPRLREILDELAPDVVVEDNVVTFPAVVATGRPWVRIVSCNPLEVPDPALPPAFSGYPSEQPSAEPRRWAEFAAEYHRVCGLLHAEFDAYCRDAGTPPLPDLQFIHPSPWLNLYLYPDEVDYRRSQPLPPTWRNVQTSVRKTDDPWRLPDRLAALPGPVVYLSLGSLGSADVPLMRRLVEALGRAPYRVVVSKGPLHDQIELPDTMTGAELLPQPSVLPHVDVVVTHGGNNTVTECLYFGKPMVLLPLFWDQHDNAARIDETGFGVRLSTYEFRDEELTAAIDRLAVDRGLHDRLGATSARLQRRPGTHLAADLIERVATEHRPVAA